MNTDPKLTTLPPTAMHAAVEVQVKIHVNVPTLGNKVLKFSIEPGQIPTRTELQSIVAACLEPASMAESSIPAGTRMLAKPEFVKIITMRDVGIALPMPGNQEFEPSGTDIPKEVLVHAIVGAGLPQNLAAEYCERGLAYLGLWEGRDNSTWEWSKEKLAELPEDMLLTIYKRIA